MKYCQKCILPASYPGISFDNNGICNYCCEYKPVKNLLGKDLLYKILSETKTKGKYDCVVPISGGKDSSYVLYYIVKELGFKPIAVFYNSGYQSKISEENVKNACETLNVPLVQINSPGNIQKKILQESYLISKKIDRPWGCANCSAILRITAHNTARKYKVPYIIWGSSKVEKIDTIPSNTDFPANKSVNTIRSKSKLESIKYLILNPIIFYRSIRYITYRIVQRFSLSFPVWFALHPFIVPPFTEKNPKVIHFFDYIDWDSMKNIKVLEDELNWKHPEDKDSRFDCSLHTAGNIYSLKKYGITLDGLNFCNFIRQGNMTRNEALLREDKIKQSLETEFKELVEKIMVQDRMITQKYWDTGN